MWLWQTFSHWCYQLSMKFFAAKILINNIMVMVHYFLTTTNFLRIIMDYKYCRWVVNIFEAFFVVFVYVLYCPSDAPSILSLQQALQILSIWWTFECITSSHSGVMLICFCVNFQDPEPWEKPRTIKTQNPACSVSQICDGEDLWQWSWLEIRLNAFRWSSIPQKQFNSSSCFFKGLVGLSLNKIGAILYCEMLFMMMRSKKY